MKSCLTTLTYNESDVYSMHLQTFNNRALNKIFHKY